jgi:hypothetical protein
MLGSIYPPQFFIPELTQDLKISFLGFILIFIIGLRYNEY